MAECKNKVACVSLVMISQDWMIRDGIFEQLWGDNVDINLEFPTSYGMQFNSFLDLNSGRVFQTSKNYRFYTTDRDNM